VSFADEAIARRNKMLRKLACPTAVRSLARLYPHTNSRITSRVRLLFPLLSLSFPLFFSKPLRLSLSLSLSLLLSISFRDAHTPRTTSRSFMCSSSSSFLSRRFQPPFASRPSRFLPPLPRSVLPATGYRQVTSRSFVRSLNPITI